MIIDLELHRYRDQLIIKREGLQTFIKDKLRKKFIVLKPEEFVRQLLLEYFSDRKDYPFNLLQIEKMIDVNGVKKRFDMIVYDRNIQPFLLIECKSHKHPINQRVMDQISIYNFALKAPYLLVTNGIDSCCVKIDAINSTYAYMEKLPDFPQN